MALDFLTCTRVLAQEISPYLTWFVEVSIWLPLLGFYFGFPDSRSFFVLVDGLGFCHPENTGPTCMWTQDSSRVVPVWAGYLCLLAKNLG